jgi:hypothetical protein
MVSGKRGVTINRKAGAVKIIQTPVRQYAAVRAPNFHAHLHAAILRAKDYPTVNEGLGRPLMGSHGTALHQQQ